MDKRVAVNEANLSNSYFISWLELLTRGCWLPLHLKDTPSDNGFSLVRFRADVCEQHADNEHVKADQY